MNLHESKLVFSPFTGICPFAGIILIWPDDGHIGTFCEDGAFTLPIGQAVKAGAGYVIFLKYSSIGVADVIFRFLYKHEKYQFRPKTAINPIHALKNTLYLKRLKNAVLPHLRKQYYVHVTLFHDYRFAHQYQLDIISKIRRTNIPIFARVWASDRNCNPMIIWDIMKMHLKCQAAIAFYINSYFPNTVYGSDHPNMTLTLDVIGGVHGETCYDPYDLLLTYRRISSSGVIRYRMDTWCGFISGGRPEKPIILVLAPPIVASNAYLYFAIHGKDLRVKVVLQQRSEILELMYISNHSVKLNIRQTMTMFVTFSVIRYTEVNISYYRAIRFWKSEFMECHKNAGHYEEDPTWLGQCNMSLTFIGNNYHRRLSFNKKLNKYFNLFSRKVDMKYEYYRHTSISPLSAQRYCQNQAGGDLLNIDSNAFRHNILFKHYQAIVPDYLKSHMFTVWIVQLDSFVLKQAEFDKNNCELLQTLNFPNETLTDTECKGNDTCIRYKNSSLDSLPLPIIEHNIKYFCNKNSEKQILHHMDKKCKYQSN